MIGNLFRSVANRQFQHSPLFQKLCNDAATDDDILTIASACPDPYSAPLMLMHAVHGLLLDGQGDDPLGAFFNTVVDEPKSHSDAYADFRRFVIANQASIIDTLSTRWVIKTDLRRGACLRSLIVEAARRLSADRIHLVDIGCSAGLNLLLDKWRISYGDYSVGPPDSPISIRTEARRTLPPTTPMPEIVTRTGIDLNLPDIASRSDRTWVLAHTAPEERDMLRACQAAMDIRARQPLRLIKGDGIALLGEVVAGLDPAYPVIVMHSLTTVMFTDAMREAFNDVLESCAASRPLKRVCMELVGPAASLFVSDQSVSRPGIVGRADIDGRWMQWLLA
ncbi:MAG: DUF2332 domain-containing protein [Parvibaculaceae bacterium]